MTEANIRDFYNDIDVCPLRCSNGLLTAPLQLQQRLEEEGYIYLSQVVDTHDLDKVHKDIVDIFSKDNLLQYGSNPLDAIPSCPPFNEGEESFFSVYDQIQMLESFHSLSHNGRLLSILKQLLGPSAYPHPLGIARLSFPSNLACTTPPHQDYPNNQGTPDLLASWIPLTDCPKIMGGLAILPKSHKQGVLPLEYSLGPGNRQAILSTQQRTEQWLSTDFKAGDVLIFHSHTLHCSLPNHSKRMRLSVDYRFQRQQEPMTQTCLNPHFGRISWENIYENWQSNKFKYYWKSLDLQISPWSEKYHELPKEHIKNAVKLNRSYQKERGSLKNKRS
jgi:hypothetical protein